MGKEKVSRSITTEQVVALVSELINKTKILNESNESIAVDIADIYESCRKYINFIDQALSTNENVEQWQNTLILIEVELDHINWHYQSLKKSLEKIL